MRKVQVFLILLFFCYCSSSPVPEGILPPEKMSVVTKDMVLADEYITNYLVKDTSKDIKKERSILYERVFTLHKTDKKTFYNSFEYYQKHPKINKVLFDSLVEKLNDKEKLKDKEKIKLQKTKD